MVLLDFRIYKESPPPINTEHGDWELVCRSVKEWKVFPDQFEGSSNPEQQKFHQGLIDDILPAVLPEIQVIISCFVLRGPQILNKLINRPRNLKLEGRKPRNRGRQR